MGYRSDVAYAVKFHHETEPEIAFAEFVRFVKWVKEEHKTTDTTDNTHYTFNQEDDADDAFKIHHKNLMISAYFTDTKWYEAYASVKWHEQLLDKVHEYSTGNYRFVRIGEEIEDTEIKDHSPTVFEMWGYVDVHRSINYSPPDETEDKEPA
jgi:hypothetical protein